MPNKTQICEGACPLRARADGESGSLTVKNNHRRKHDDLQ